MEKVVGIDLGTTNSAIAAVDSFTGKGECIQNKDGVNLTASAVCFENRKEIIIGNTARECKIIYPETTAINVKRQIGVEKVAITVDGKDYSPQQISALVLKSMKEDAERELGQDVCKAVITVPAYFDSNQRQATKEAGMEAGFEVLDLLDEPVAALYSADTIKNYAGKTVLIYDLGGGTLDIVCAKITEDSIDEICIAGDNHLGGSDWNNAFITYIKNQYLEDVSLDVSAEQELANKVEMAKEELSRKSEVSFTVMTSVGRKEISVSKKEFEISTLHLFDRALQVLENVKGTLEEKGVFEVDQIILCGGSTRMPQIKEGIEEIYPEVKIFAKDRDQAVVKGAAIYAEALMKEKQPLISRNNQHKIKKLNRVTGRNYGIAAIVDEDERKVCNMLMKNIQLPVAKEDVFYTRYENQKQVALEVYENTSECHYEEIHKASHIGKCYLNIEGELPKNSPIIVNLSLEENGVLCIHSYEESGKTEVTAYLQTQALHSGDELLAEKKVVDDLYIKVS